MANVHGFPGFSHAQALTRVPTSVNADVSKDVAQLKELGVKAAPKAYIKGLVKDNLRLVLKERLSVGKDPRGVGGDDKGAAAKAIVKNISPSLRGPILNRVEKRLERMSGEQIQAMTNLLQKQGPNVSISDRMVIRSALLLAFANRSNGNEMVRLKTFLTGADTHTRSEVFKALNTSNPNVTSVLDAFEKGPFQAAPDDAQTLVALVKDEDVLRSVMVPKLVDAYMEKLEASTGITSSHPDYETIKCGATAVSAYTSSVHENLNETMRANNGGVKAPLTPERELMCRAATDFLSRLPDFQGIVSRGGGSGWQADALAKYVPGQIVTEYTFVSSSANKGFTGSIQFLIESHHGKEVSDLSVAPKDGREVLFPPGTRFEVLGVHQATEDMSMDNAGVWAKNPNGEKTLVIVMREVD